jgi:hypothetical protein
VSDGLNAGGAGPMRPPPHLTCKHCGGIVAPQPVLDSRQGRSYGLSKCLSCEKLNWSEEESPLQSA